ncbi:hypothetical protein CIHG_08794 [Coccidioides immitis H538.4]|uniref:Uncharacterized protein n=3 Tax=Coccidioides immitis TaxID=5501 RepID=A0A0J8TUM7_COCIT|nr:hypothetical protein CIRG_04689 [Coccidioides immitis RMSCC 2394]KMU77532.1 hypothetical protein CISG_01290 [Coccidioides immitis RMSCC 3703]KMU90938.1 hypothetical protein CIHG_08794 [Coccidioides immitis H538.4]
MVLRNTSSRQSHAASTRLLEVKDWKVLVIKHELKIDCNTYQLLYHSVEQEMHLQQIFRKKLSTQKNRKKLLDLRNATTTKSTTYPEKSLGSWVKAACLQRSSGTSANRVFWESPDSLLTIEGTTYPSSR